MIGGINNVNLDFDRMIAFDRNGKSLIDWQRVSDDPTAPPFRNTSTDLSPIPDVKRITSNTLVDGADKFSGLIQFGADLQPYFYTIVPVKQGNDMVGGLMIAIKVDRLLLALQRSTPGANHHVLQSAGRGDRHHLCAAQPSWLR